jgi:enterochelin esterase-like enzyme
MLRSLYSTFYIILIIILISLSYACDEPASTTARYLAMDMHHHNQADALVSLDFSHDMQEDMQEDMQDIQGDMQQDSRTSRHGNCPPAQLIWLTTNAQENTVTEGIWADARIKWSMQTWQWTVLNPTEITGSASLSIEEFVEDSSSQNHTVLWQCHQPSDPPHLPNTWQSIGSAMAIYHVVAQDHDEMILQSRKLTIKKPLRVDWVYNAIEMPTSLTADQLQLFWWPLPQSIQLAVEYQYLQDSWRAETDILPTWNELLQGESVASSLIEYRHLPSTAKPLALKNPSFDLEHGKVSFEITDFGLYVLAYRPSRSEPKKTKITYRAIAGVSMGGGASAVIAARHPERFDYVGALGGISDWIYLIDYTRRKLMGGFCTQAQRQAGLACPTPSSSHPIEQVSTYESWVYSNNGADFDRNQYVKIFQDMSLTHGNPFSFNSESSYLPSGIPFSDQLRSKSQRCQPECRGEGCPEVTEWVRLSNFYDDEYNPEGIYPVIPFCDGEDGDPSSVFNPQESHSRPVEVLLAVDLNDNGRRDAGEPVIRNTSEPFQDIGCDGLASSQEPGYHPLWNPDPHGDDFHWRKNPRGTEGDTLFQGSNGQVGLENIEQLPPSVIAADRNGLQKFKLGLQHLACTSNELGEPFDDVGLDGVAMTAAFSEGGYDWGEGNAVFDYNPNLLRFYAHNPAHYLYQALTQEEHFLRIWLDGGIRDLFNFAITSMHLAGRLQGEVTQDNAIHAAPLRLYEGFEDLAGLDHFTPSSETQDQLNNTGWHVLLRYGDPQATPEDIEAGDGAHVGTNAQAVSRLNAFLHWTHQNWRKIMPPQDRAPANIDASLTEEVNIHSPLMGGIYHFVVSLPPGYHHPDNQNLQYPVVYMLHGYGQRASSLAPTSLIFQSFMSNKIWPDSIFVYPEASCEVNRLDACSDDIDNDEDGMIDLDDDDCHTTSGRSESAASVSRCQDGIDNDLDGRIDAEDPGCIQPSDNGEGECQTGTFYATHSAWEDGQIGGWDYEGAFLDMMDYVDQNYRVLPTQEIDMIRP